MRAHPAHRREDRGSSTARGYNYRWRKAREFFLRHHPLCATCQAKGRTTAATVVDHIIPHKGNKTLFWDPDNWQPLCETHHNRKTVTQDGGLGRPATSPQGRPNTTPPV